MFNVGEYVTPIGIVHGSVLYVDSFGYNVYNGHAYRGEKLKVVEQPNDNNWFYVVEDYRGERFYPRATQIMSYDDYEGEF